MCIQCIYRKQCIYTEYSVNVCTEYSVNVYTEYSVIIYTEYSVNVYTEYSVHIYTGDGGFATNKIATARISVVYNCQLY